MLRVGQKQRVQTVAAREETHRARKKHVHVAVKAVMRRVRMTNADPVAKVVRHRVAKAVRRLVAKDVRRLVAKVVRHRVAKAVLRRVAKVAPLHVAKVAPLPATKVAPRRVARVALARGWKRPLVVAVTRSHRLRVVDQPSHRVHQDR